MEVYNREISTIIKQAIFLLFIVPGATTNLKDVIDFSNMMILGLAFPNLIVLYIFVPKIVSELKSYKSKVK